MGKQTVKKKKGSIKNSNRKVVRKHITVRSNIPIYFAEPERASAYQARRNDLSHQERPELCYCCSTATSFGCSSSRLQLSSLAATEMSIY